MEILADPTPDMLAVPRFDDGMIDMQELIRRLTEQMLNAIMDAEADQLCAGGVNSRNGYRERALKTCVGDITMRVPKLRSGSFFPDDVIERYQRVDRALVAAVVEMYATGTSTRKVQRIAEKKGISRLSKDQASVIAASLDADIDELCGRPLDGSPPFSICRSRARAPDAFLKVALETVEGPVFRISHGYDRAPVRRHTTRVLCGSDPIVENRRARDAQHLGNVLARHPRTHERHRLHLQRGIVIAPRPAGLPLVRRVPLVQPLVRRMARGVSQLAHRARDRSATLVEHLDGLALLLIRIARHSRTPNRTDLVQLFVRTPPTPQVHQLQQHRSEH